MRTRMGIAVVALTIAGALPAEAQQRVERFPEAEPERTASELTIQRQSYWLEGVAIGVAVGVGAGLLFVEEGGMCTTGVPGECYPDPSRAIGTVLLGVGGGFVGGMIGASISRE